MYLLVFGITWIQTIIGRVDHVVFDEDGVHGRRVGRTIHIHTIRDVIHGISLYVPNTLRLGWRGVVNARKVGARRRTRHTVEGVVQKTNVGHVAGVIHQAAIGCTTRGDRQTFNGHIVTAIQANRPVVGGSRWAVRYSGGRRVGRIRLERDFVRCRSARNCGNGHLLSVGALLDIERNCTAYTGSRQSRDRGRKRCVIVRSSAARVNRVRPRQLGEQRRCERNEGHNSEPSQCTIFHELAFM